MKSSKLRLIPLAVGLALVAGMVPGAMAKSTSARLSSSSAVENHAVKSTVSLSYAKRSTTFNGTVGYVAAEVSPDEGGCVDGRRISLFKVTRRGSDKIDSTSTVGDGDFSFRFRRAQSGTFEVRVAPSTFSDRYGDLIECSGARDSVRV